MSSYLDKTGLERVWSKATDKFATIVTTDELGGRILNLETNSATKQEVSDEVAKLVDSAPETLDTLNELAAALGDDPNFATTMATEIGKKVNSSDYNDAIGSINSHISTINGEIDELQEASEQHLNKEDYLGPIIKEGNPIVYDNGVEGFDIKVETTFGPKQAGSGDPYPMGGGRNKLVGTAVTQTANGVTFTVNDDMSITVNGTATENTPFQARANVKLNAGQYIITKGNEDNNISMWLNANGSDYYADGAFELAADTSNGVVILYVPAGATVNSTVYPMIRLASDTDAAYAPPSNIRPITGLDAVELNHAGKNLIPDNVTLRSCTKTDNGYICNINNHYYSEIAFIPTFKLNAGMEITYSIKDYIANRFISITFVFDDNTTQDFSSPLGARQVTATVPNNGKTVSRILLRFNRASAVFTDTTTVVSKHQLEFGSDATTFAPYTNTLHTVQIGQTVYGGKMDWLTGKLVAEWAMVTLDGTKTFEYTNGKFGRSGICPDAFGYEAKCSHFRNEMYFQASDPCVVVYPGGFVDVRYTKMASADEFNAFISAQYAAGTPVQIAYKLATPIEIQLTPTQISELEGINTLYGDGDSIRAIFKSTGGTSTTLETISGVLPVEKGGTGATSAAGARSNLGITPQNIGALSTSGGTLNGSILLDGGTNWKAYRLQRTISNAVNEVQIGISDDSSLEIIKKKDGSTINYMALQTSATSFGKPVSISSGGTGATDAATARSNLGITPANIGAAPTSHASTATTYGVGSTTNYGHLKVGSNISVSSGTISLSKENITTALGYTPPTTDTNTTYTFATGDSNGQIKVTPSGGSAQNISVKGLGSAAYKDASGSWGISITGSSASCTGNAATATTLSATLAVGKGGTGITSNPSMLVNLGSTSAASVFAASPRPGITGTLGIENGGTGATSKSGARTNLGINSGTTLPSSAGAGDIFFLYS